MTIAIPKQTKYSFKKGNRGVVPWAIQRSLNHAGHRLVEDGVYGPQTKRAVMNFQRRFGLYVDGVFGPASSSALAAHLGGLAEERLPVVPKGILKGMVEGESGNLIGAVNWSTAGGVDCGYLQRRVYESAYKQGAVIRRAFDGYYQMGLLVIQLNERHKTFLERPGAKIHERAWRLAILNHNYPYAADLISRVGIGGLSSYWTSAQQWVINIGVKFPDGLPIYTPLEWCQKYSLGNREHNEPGFMARYVSNWN